MMWRFLNWQPNASASFHISLSTRILFLPFVSAAVGCCWVVVDVPRHFFLLHSSPTRIILIIKRQQWWLHHFRIWTRTKRRDMRVEIWKAITYVTISCQYFLREWENDVVGSNNSMESTYSQKGNISAWTVVGCHIIVK